MPKARWVTSALAGAVLLNLAYPPFHLILPSFVCLTPVIVALEETVAADAPVRRAMKLGGLFALAAYGVTLHWMALALWRHEPLWVLGYAVVVLILAAVTAITFAAVSWLRRRTGLSTLLVFPCLWTAAEWSLARLGPLSYAWLGLGTSLTGYPALIQVADLVGARGITFLLATANAALAVAWLRRQVPVRAARPIAGVVAGIAAAMVYGEFRIRNLEYRTIGRVAVLSTLVAADRQPTIRAGAGLAVPIALSRMALDANPDLVIWPESALPGAMLYHPEWTRSIGSLARESSVFVLAGGIDGVPTPGGLQQHNAAFLFGPDGRQAAQPYRKRRLVPLVEWRGGITPGAGGMIQRTRHGRIGVLICGEATFESMAREYRRQGVDALVNPSNDAWFAVSAGPAQHAAHAVMRAIENRIGVARATNLGVSRIIDPTGRVVREVAQATPGVAVAPLTTTAGISVYAQLGDWLGSLCGMTAVLLICFTARPHVTSQPSDAGTYADSANGSSPRPS